MASAPPPAEPTITTRGSLRAVFRNAGWLLGGKGVGAVLSLVYLAIVTRSLGPEAFGQFALVLGAGQAAAMIVTFQSWQIVVRYGLPLLRAGDDASLARLIRYTTTLDIGAAIVGVVLVTGGILLLAGHFGWTDAFAWQAIGTCAMIVLSARGTPVGILRLHDRYAVAAAADAVTPVVRFLGALVVWLIHPSVIAFLIVWAVSEALTAAANWIAAHRAQPFHWPAATRAGVLADNPGIGRYTIITNLTSSLGVGGRQLAVLIVGLVVTPAAAGGFRLVQQLAGGMAKLSDVMSRALFPELMRSRGDGTGDEARFQKLLGKAMRAAAIGGGTVFLLVLLIGKPVLHLIAGEAFLSAYPILLALGTAAAIDFAGVSLEPALVALGRADLPLKIRGTGTGLMIALMFVLPQWLDAIGAGLAVLAGSIFSFAVMGWAVRRQLRRSARNAR